LLAVAAATLLLIAPPGSARAQAAAKAESSAAVKPLPFLSPIFGDNMVLQRGKANTLWGWSEHGDKIRVQVGDNTASAIAGADRRWEVRIQPPPAGGPYTLRISGRETLELHNVVGGCLYGSHAMAPRK
jgi:sialate O-acetylesterase